MIYGEKYNLLKEDYRQKKNTSDKKDIAKYSLRPEWSIEKKYYLIEPSYS